MKKNMTSAGVLRAQSPVSSFTGFKNTIKSESAIYVAGLAYNGGGIQLAKVWKIGVEIELTDGFRHAYAFSVFVS